MQVFLPKMKTAVLKLVLSIALTLTVADDDVVEILSCSRTTDKLNTNEVTPIKYDVELTLTPHIKVISGKIDITITIKTTTSKIRLYAHDLRVNDWCVRIVRPDESTDCKSGSLGRLKSQLLCSKYEILLLEFANSIYRGQYILHLEYTSPFEENLYTINYPYSWIGIEKRYLITNLYELNATRGLFPYLGDVKTKAPVHLTVKHNKLYTVFSNVHSSNISYSSTDTDEFKLINFQDSSIIPSYMFAIAMIHGITKNPTETFHQLWHRPSVVTTHVEKIIHNVMLSFEQKIKLDVTKFLKKIDHIILLNNPVKSAGKPGLIIYSEKDVTYEQDTDFPGQYIHVARTIAYELSRQVFVGYMNSHLKSGWWINKMLTSFYSYYVLDQIFDTWTMDLFVVQNLLTVLNYDIPIKLKTTIYNNKDDGIDSLLYSLLYEKKGFVLFRMLFYLLTPEKFNEAVNEYIHSHTTDLWTILQKKYFRQDKTKYSIKQIMETWLLEKSYPEITFEREYTLTNYNSSKRFLNKVPLYMYVPLTYAIPKDINISHVDVVWYEGGEKEYIYGANAKQFFLVNLELVGCYRVNYDDKNWQLLSAHLKSNSTPSIPVLNRAQIVNDAYYFTIAEKLSPTVFFDVIQFLHNETDYIAWYPMFNILSYMSAYLPIAHEELARLNFLNILDGLLKNVGYDQSPDDETMTMALRLLAIKWACKLGHSTCRNVTANKLITYIYKYDSYMTPWLTSWMYCAGMMSVNLTVWYDILNIATEHKNEELLESLSCSENVQVILHYLNLILYTNIGQQKRLNMGQIYHSVIKKHVRKDAVFQYVLDNYNYTLTRFPNFNNVTLMGNIIMNLDNEEQLEEVRYYINKKFLKKDYQLWKTCIRLTQERLRQVMKLRDKFRINDVVRPMLTLLYDTTNNRYHRQLALIYREDIMPKMGTAFLKFLFITILTLTPIFVVAEYIRTKNCFLNTGRLSIDEVVPLKYEVELTLMPHNNNISGTTDIMINMIKSRTYIRLHASDLEIKYLIITKPDRYGQYPKGKLDENSIHRPKELIFCSEYESVLIIFHDPIPSGKHILRIQHSSPVENNLYKIYYPYSWTGIEKRWLITNLYAPNTIRRLFPCWDDPAVKASFRIKVIHDERFVVLSNIPSQSSYKHNLGRVWTYINETSIPTHLLAIMVVRGIKIDYVELIPIGIHHIWHKPGFTTPYKYAQTIIHNISLSISWDTTFNLTTYLTELKHVILPNSPMKSAGKRGLIIYRQTDITYNNGIDFPGQQIHVAKVVAYELARQLFSFMDPSLDNEWINEILASFYGYYILHEMWSDKTMELFVVQNFLTVLDYENFLKLEFNIHQAKNDGIDGLLYSLLYHKKAFVLIRMLLHLVTPQNFRLALGKYINSWYKSDRPELWTCLQNVYSQEGNTIKEIMESWLVEKYYPEIKFIRDYNTGTVEYRATFASQNNVSKIPLTYATPETISSYNTSNVIWYEGRLSKFITDVDPQQFFLANMELVGYYRVNYDTNNWLLLAAYLQSANSARIPALNRAQIVNDAFYFTIMGKLESAVFFNVTHFLKNEIDYIVWYPMFNIFSNMSTYLKYPEAELVREKFVDLLSGLLENLSYKERPNEDAMMVPLRLLAIKWACTLNLTDCKKKAASNLMEYMNYYTDTIPWMSNWMFCEGMKDANLTVWEEIFHVASQHKHTELLESLSCSENVTVILHYLDLMLNNHLEDELKLHKGKMLGLPIGKMFQTVLKKHVRRSDVLKFALDNYNQIMKRFPYDLNNTTFMANIIMNVYNDKELNKIMNFTKKEFLCVDQLCPFLSWIEKQRHQIMKVRHMFRMF
ncbi:uncharacterized protein LOC116851950 [Odontomachus brunneus]|uniref:uncharacterized protein LOC116851950 n=1 Tax=Odontomachus brunneus TaxID=486640 RepID=UPI0013F1F3D0|nr:uncharacterized protein LOC116851950 [Odontomachus brunneus]